MKAKSEEALGECEKDGIESLVSYRPGQFTDNLSSG